MAFHFTEAQLVTIEQLAARYPVRRAALLPVLWMVQRQEGWVSPEAMESVATVIGVTPADVYEVVTFYSMFERKACARHHIQVCRTISCWLRGAKALTHYLEEKLAIRVGEITADGRFKLSAVECLGSCGTAPMMQVGDHYYEDLTREKVDQVLSKCQ